MKTLAIMAVSALTLAACEPTYLRDGREANADGSFGHYAGTCNPGVIVDPTVCFAHLPNGAVVPISGPNAAYNAGVLLGGVGALAGGTGELAYGLRYFPDIVSNVNTNRAPTSVNGSVTGNGPVNVSASNSAASNASANPVTRVSNTTSNLNRISLEQANLQIANQRQTAIAKGGKGGAGGAGGAGGNGSYTYVDP